MEKRDLLADKKEIEDVYLHFLPPGTEYSRSDLVALHAINRALTVERELAALMQALRDGFTDDVQHPTKADLLYWITSTCPWMEGVLNENQRTR